jgi:CO/xanthine dehydrogenase Mo-binding subunit
MLWGATRRAEVAHARLRRVDVTPALALPGVHAVLTLDDVPGHRYQGQKITDEPVLAEDEIRRHGEPIAVVAADDPETARRAAQAIVVELEELEPLTDLEEALARGELFRHVRVRRGDPAARGEVVVEDTYTIATQDPAALGTEAGLAIPDGHGGLDLWGPTQWTHIDLPQLAACLALEPAQIRVHPARLGGAFGSREDLSMQTHLGMLALRTGRPVKMVYDRTESFVGHVKRHAALMHYRHEADRDGRLVRVEARLLLDSGPYELTSAAVVANSTYFALGPYRCERVEVDGYALRTNNPLAGAMRGFGANQPCFAAETQMDRLAAALGMDPLELRLRNAIGPGDHLATTGQLIEHPLPVAEVIRSVAAIPLPDPLPGTVTWTPACCPAARDAPPRRPRSSGGSGTPSGSRTCSSARASTTTRRRGSSSPPTARSSTPLRSRSARARHDPGADRPEHPRDVPRRGRLRPHGADRLGRVHLRIEADADGRWRRAARGAGGPRRRPGAGRRRRPRRRRRVARRGTGRPLAELLADGPLDERVCFKHRPTDEPDADGQGDLHVDFCVAAHRAVVDVDPELGLVRVVEIAIAQDVGRVLNPLQLHGQIEGGIAQGMGHASWRRSSSSGASSATRASPTTCCRPASTPRRWRPCWWRSRPRGGPTAPRAWRSCRRCRPRRRWWRRSGPRPAGP